MSPFNFSTLKNILIIDDDADDREMFYEALREVIADAVCYSASNGHKALMALDDGEFGIPSLIFLDINMPVMNGWQFLSKLKGTEKYKNIPVIMYSTSSQPEDLEKAQHSGALCFFTKPSRFLELKNILALVAEHIHNNSLETLHTAILYY